nr:syntaxin-51 [Quercus suber]
MVASLNISSFNNRDSLLWPNIKQYDIVNRTNVLNNRGLVGFRCQITKAQFWMAFYASTFSRYLHQLKSDALQLFLVALSIMSFFHYAPTAWKNAIVKPSRSECHSSFGENSFFEVELQSPKKSCKVTFLRKNNKLLEQPWSCWLLVANNERTGFYPVEGLELEPFVVGSLIQLLCRVTKFGWLDDDRFEEVIKEAMNFLCQVIHW